jgi:hypothetical protein
MRPRPKTISGSVVGLAAVEQHLHAIGGHAEVHRMLHHEAGGGADRDRRGDPGVGAATAHGEAGDPETAEISGDDGEIVTFDAATFAPRAEGAAAGVAEVGHLASLSLLGQQRLVSL